MIEGVCVQHVGTDLSRPAIPHICLPLKINQSEPTVHVSVMHRCGSLIFNIEVEVYSKCSNLPMGSRHKRLPVRR